MKAENTNSGAADAPGTPPAAVMAPDSARESIGAPARSGGALGVPRDGGTSAPAPAAPPAKRGPGKPKGLPKSGGRAKGTPNRSTIQTRDRIQELADPIAFLSDVMNGVRMTAAGEVGDMKRTWVFPTLQQRVSAGETLLRKLLPDLKSQELTGAGGTPLIEPPTHRENLMSNLEQAMVISFALRKGDEAKKELDEMDGSLTDAEYEPIPEPEPELELETVTEAPEPPAEPPEPPLPKHAFIFIEQGERERSGERAWLAMEDRDVLNTFHGADARQKARDWVGTKFGASPAEEIEVPLSEAVTQ